MFGEFVPLSSRRPFDFLDSSKARFARYEAMGRHKKRKAEPKANRRLLRTGWYVPKLVALICNDEPLLVMLLSRT